MESPEPAWRALLRLHFGRCDGRDRRWDIVDELAQGRHPCPADRFAVRRKYVGQFGKWIGRIARISSVGQQQQSEFAAFYQSNRDDCLRAVLAVVGDRQAAEDLVAEAFVRAWGSWRKVRQHPAPRAWIMRTALNTRISWWRRRHREVPLAEHDSVAAMRVDVGVDPVLMHALRELPRRQREVVALRVFLDFDTDATARALGIAPGTVTAHLSRAIATLRGQFVTARAQEVHR